VIIKGNVAIQLFLIEPLIQSDILAMKPDIFVMKQKNIYAINHAINLEEIVVEIV
jgi:hypothetical protein